MSTKSEAISDREKVEQYEKLLHKIQAYAYITMDERKVARLINNICAWSYAHRCGNGENSEKEQQRLIDDAFWKLTNV